jgi:hypothetical protein
MFVNISLAVSPLNASLRMTGYLAGLVGSMTPDMAPTRCLLSCTLVVVYFKLGLRRWAYGVAWFRCGSDVVQLGCFETFRREDASAATVADGGTKRSTLKGNSHAK